MMNFLWTSYLILTKLYEVVAFIISTYRWRNCHRTCSVSDGDFNSNNLISELPLLKLHSNINLNL